VAAAVGEGSRCIQSLHQYLEEEARSGEANAAGA